MKHVGIICVTSLWPYACRDAGAQVYDCNEMVVSWSPIPGNELLFLYMFISSFF